MLREVQIPSRKDLCWPQTVPWKPSTQGKHRRRGGDLCPCGGERLPTWNVVRPGPSSPASVACGCCERCRFKAGKTCAVHRPCLGSLPHKESTGGEEAIYVPVVGRGCQRGTWSGPAQAAPCAVGLRTFLSHLTCIPSSAWNCLWKSAREFRKAEVTDTINNSTKLQLKENQCIQQVDRRRSRSPRSQIRRCLVILGSHRSCGNARCPLHCVPEYCSTNLCLTCHR